MMTAAERKRERMEREYDESLFLDNRTYVLYLCATVFYGLVVNALICYLVGDRVPEIVETLGVFGIIVPYIVLCSLGTFIAYKSTNPAVSFLGYNLLVLPVGLMVSIAVYAAGGAGAYEVRQAVMATAAVTFCMLLAGYAKPEFFMRWGRVLLLSLGVLVILEVVLLLLHREMGLLTFAGAAIFTLYIGYDVSRAMYYPRTADNAIDCAMDIYLDIINLFLKILRMLSRSRSRR